MRFLRNALALALLAISTVAVALTPTERVLLFGKIRPVWTANFLSPALVASQTLPAGLTYTNSGSIPATLFDSTGKLTYQGNNLLAYSGSLTNAYWNAISLTVTGGVADPVGGTGAFTLSASSPGYIYKSVAYTGNAVAAVWLKSRSGTGTVYLSSPNNTTHAVAVTGTWTQFYYSGADSSGFVYMNIGVTPSSGTLTVDVYAPTLSAVTYETAPRQQDQVITQGALYLAPRLDTNPSTLAPRGLLVEQASTNLVYPSQGAAGNTGYTNNASTYLSNNATSPDGTATATQVSETTANAFHGVNSTSHVTTIGTAATFSFYAKAGTATVIQALTGSNISSTFWANFDLSGGAIGSVGAGTTASMVSVGNGWYRCIMTGTAAATTGDIFVGFTNNSTSATRAPSYVGSASQNFYFYGVQAEALSFATSLIPTTSATVTRTADVVQFAGVPLAALQGAQGTAIVQTTDFATPVTASAFIGSTTSSNFPAYYFGAGPTIRTYNGTTAIDVSGTPTISSPIRTALAWGAGGRSITYNGRTVASDSGLYVAPSSAWLGVQNSATQYWLNGHFASVALYNKNLPSPTLQQKSVVGAPW